jgi:hypothetical protein
MWVGPKRSNERKEVAFDAGICGGVTLDVAVLYDNMDAAIRTGRPGGAPRAWQARCAARSACTI